MCNRPGHHKPWNKPFEEDAAHLKKIAYVESYYSRKSNPNRTCLSPDLSSTKMYARCGSNCHYGGGSFRTHSQLRPDKNLACPMLIFDNAVTR